jgi:hypothetical protein
LKEHAPDPPSEATERETEAAFDPGSEGLGHCDVSTSNLNLHLFLRRENQGTSPGCSSLAAVPTPIF